MNHPQQRIDLELDNHNITRIKDIAWSTGVVGYPGWIVLDAGPDWLRCKDDEGKEIFVNLANVLNIRFEQVTGE